MKRSKLTITVCGLIMGLMSVVLCAENFPVTGEWVLCADTRSYKISIDENAMVSYWKKESQSWCEYGHALILQEIKPVVEKRNMILIIKIKGDVFKFPYNEGQQEFKGICLLSFNIDYDDTVILATQAQKCNLWRPIQ